MEFNVDKKSFIKMVYIIILGSNYPVKNFYDEISNVTGGQSLSLDNFK